MDPSISSESSLSRDRRRLVGCLLVAVSFFAGGILAWLFLPCPSSVTGSIWDRLWSSLRSSTHIDGTQPAVVQKIQQLQRLETVVYTMDKIVAGNKENPILPDFLAGDRLLMLVHGEVVAGVDFGSLKPADLTIASHKVTIHVPEAQVFSTRLDSARTRVYSRQTGLLVPTDPDLETQVRQEAEHQIHDAAVADGILTTAQQNARATLTSLLQGLGFTEVEFR